MAKKKSSNTSTSTETKTTTTTRSKGVSFNKIMDMLAFVAVIIGGVALLVAVVLDKLPISISLGFITALRNLANAIGWLVLSILSFKYIKTKRNVWLWVTWSVSVVVIFICIILMAF